MTIWQRLRSCQKGASAVEFALIAPVFFLMLFGVIEGGRMIWTRQTLDEVAFSTARCMSLEIDCPDEASQREYAKVRAANYGVAIANGNITVTGNTTCQGYAGANAVTIRKAFNSPVTGFVPGMDGTLVATACYPVLG